MVRLLRDSVKYEHLERPRTNMSQHSSSVQQQQQRQEPVGQQRPIRQRAMEIFDVVKHRAGPGYEIEMVLDSTFDENLRFGNNELSQSQFSTSHTLSIRLAANKKQARTTTGRLDRSSIEKTVDNAIVQAKAAPEDP